MGNSLLAVREINHKYIVVERRKCYPQEIPEDKILLTFCPQTYHLLWIKIFSISAHLPTLSKKPITGVGVKSNLSLAYISLIIKLINQIYFPRLRD